MITTVGRTASLSKAAVVNYLRRKPLCISFEITHCCNAKCHHCHRGGSFKEKRASPEKFGMLSRDLSPPVAQISGGEPLLRKDVYQVVEAVRRPDGGPYLVFVTNGALLTESTYHRLIDAGIDQFSVSLDYPDDRHDQFREIPGLFEHLKRLVEKLGADNTINFNCVVQSQNYRDLIAIAELAREWGVNLNYSPYTTLRTHDHSLMLKGEQLREFDDIIAEVAEFKAKHNTVRTSIHFMKDMRDFFENESLPNCRAGERFLVVNPDGTLSPCGLIMTAYPTLEAMKEGFVSTNTCTACNTCIRANTEKPLNNLVRGGLVDILARP